MSNLRRRTLIPYAETLEGLRSAAAEREGEQHQHFCAGCSDKWDHFEADCRYGEVADCGEHFGLGSLGLEG